MTSAVLGVVLLPAVVATSLALVRGRPPRRRLMQPSLGRGRGGRVVVVGGLVATVRRRAGVRSHGSDVVSHLLEGWSANLRVGMPVGAALRTTLDDTDDARATLPRTVASIATGADPARSLEHDAESLRDESDRRAVQAVAACVRVARDHGGRLADSLDRVGDSLRADRLHVAHVRAQLAGPRATARLLAALPLLGLVMSSGLGLDPAHELVGDRYGRLALVAGLLLDGAGLYWTAGIARAAERST